jgi:hypothetical protein
MKSTLKPAILAGAAMSPVVWGLAQGHNDNCSNETLKGVYGLSISGTRPGPPPPSGTPNYVPGIIEQPIGVGTRTFDGEGNFTQLTNGKGSLSGILFPNTPPLPRSKSLTLLEFAATGSSTPASVSSCAQTQVEGELEVTQSGVRASDVVLGQDVIRVDSRLNYSCTAERRDALTGRTITPTSAGREKNSICIRADTLSIVRRQCGEPVPRCGSENPLRH